MSEALTRKGDCRPISSARHHSSSGGDVGVGVTIKAVAATPILQAKCQLYSRVLRMCSAPGVVPCAIQARLAQCGRREQSGTGLTPMMAKTQSMTWLDPPSQ